MRKRNSKTTISGKVRIKPLNIEQLESLVTQRPRDTDKINNRIKILKSRPSKVNGV